MRPSSRFQLLAGVVVLEVASGLPYGVVNELVPVWLKVHGVDTKTLGVLTLVGLPWTLKALWAPLVDRHLSFHAWILAGLGAAALTIALLPVVGPVPALLGALLLAIAFASATQDVAIDGYLVAAVPPEDQGRATGVRVASYRGAMALVGGGAVVLGDQVGWDVAFGAAVATLVVAGLFVARLPAAPRPPPTPAADWAGLFGRWVAEPGTLWLFAFVLLYKLGDSAMGPMVKPFLLDTGLSATEVGMLSSTGGAVLVAIGAVLGGEFLSRVGLPAGVLTLGALQAVSNLGYAGAAWAGTREAAYVASLTESLTAGLGTAALLALAMRAASGSQGATRFALLTAIVGLTRTLSGAISGFAVEGMGYAGWFALTFLMALPALALVPTVTRRPAPTP